MGVILVLYEERFEWVTDEQRSQLESIYGEEWGEPLDLRFVEYYGEDWLADFDDDSQLVAMLDQVLPTLLEADGSGEQGAAETAVDVAGLDWLRDDQVEQLGRASGTRGDYREWFPAALDDAWPDWRQSTPEVLSEWVDGLIPTLLVDISDLSWVTDEQATALDQAGRGDFREWLPDELDRAWPEWRLSTADVIGPWLDGLIPSLVLVSTPVEEESAAAEAEEAPSGDGEADAPAGDESGEGEAEVEEYEDPVLDALSDEEFEELQLVLE